MASTEATLVPADRHDDASPVGSTSATDDSARTPVESNHNSTEPDSKTAGTGRSDLSKRSANKSTNKKHTHSKCKSSSKSAKKGAEKSSLTDSEDDAQSSASDTSDSDADSDNEKTKAKLKKNTKVLKSTKATKAKQQSKSSTKKKSKKDQKKGQKKKTKSKPADSDSSSDSDSSDDADSDADESSDQPGQQDEISQELRTLKLQVTQLQHQLIQTSQSASYAPWSGNMGYQLSLPMQPLMTGPISPSVLPPHPPRSPPAIPPNGRRGRRPDSAQNASSSNDDDEDAANDSQDETAKSKSKSKSKKGPKKVDFKRVDWVWDDKIHNYRLQDTAEASSDSQYEDFIFHVRRTFDWEGKFRTTYVDIRSKLLRECLQDVIGNVTGVSLVDEVPKIEPNFLFLYLEDLRDHRKALKLAEPAGDSKKERKKNQKRLDNKRKHLKVLLKYLDNDFAATKESLYPMLESGLITFDLLWALWKPNTLAYMPTYGTASEPRAFKVEMAELHASILKGQFYYIDGKYFEYDGKKYGFGNLSEEIPSFVGARKITSLPCYPLKYHQNEAQITKDLIERGKKFVSLKGVHYKSYQGIAFLKRKKMVVKFHVQKSRVMVDSAIFRRINPNYNVSLVKAKDLDTIPDPSSDSEDGCCCEASDSDAEEGGDDKIRFVTKVFKDRKGSIQFARMVQEETDGEEAGKLDVLPERKATDQDGDVEEADGDGEVVEEFTDEEYLIASPVVLGFAFSEKQWLEFTVSGIEDIKWNEKAWDSLVLEDGTKDLIKALVESRKYQAANTIDDVIQGKGKGLVTVLHGPPGTGKTLTAEGISELLKCPLYMASAGELGTDSRFLEAELQKILDICHAWGAILLLDEADVFLEKRDMHNIHRNALVSIFLRQLEYFQGILFLTTNRVETFDEAFQSRIHIALRYDNLDAKAKRAIFEMFINKVQALGKIEVKPLTNEDLNMLSKQDLNGREIKNVVGSAQDLAVNKGEALSMRHIQQVLNVHAKFGRDLKGGTGYEDAMRSYF